MSGFIVRQCPGQIVLYGEKKTRNLPGIQRHPSAFNRKIFLEINAAWYCRKCIETKVHTYYIILPRLIQPWYASIKATSVWLIRSITSLLDEITEESPNRQMDVPVYWEKKSIFNDENFRLLEVISKCIVTNSVYLESLHFLNELLNMT